MSCNKNKSGHGFSQITQIIIFFSVFNIVINPRLSVSKKEMPVLVN